MLNQKKALLLIGSPKVKNSTSESLGNYIISSLGKKGWTCEKLHILSSLKKGVEEFLYEVNDADILIVAFPLYVDSLPSPVIRALELIADSRSKKTTDKRQGLIAIANSGFPEAFQNDTALEICKSFADKAHFKWLGGLAMGCGAAINGRPIEHFGGMTRNVIKALEMAADAITNDEAVPFEAVEMMSSKLFPIWLYTFAGNRSWKTQAKQFNKAKQLYDKPYLEE